MSIQRKGAGKIGLDAAALTGIMLCLHMDKKKNLCLNNTIYIIM